MANKQGSKGVEDSASAHGRHVQRVPMRVRKDEDEPTTQALDEDDVIIMRTYGREAQCPLQSARCQNHCLLEGVGPYVGPIKTAELPS